MHLVMGGSVFNMFNHDLPATFRATSTAPFSAISIIAPGESTAGN